MTRLRITLPLLLATATAAKSTYWREVDAKKMRPTAAAYCPKRCFKTEASGAGLSPGERRGITWRNVL